MGEITMFTGTRILVAWTAMALLALPTLAAEKSAAKADEKPAAKSDEKSAAKADEKPAAETDEKASAEADKKPSTDAQEKSAADVEQASYQTARKAQPRTVSVWRGSAPPIVASPARLAQRDPSDAVQTPFGDDADNEMPAFSEQIQADEDAESGSVNGSIPCDHCAEPGTCDPFWTHRSGIFGEYLYLHATGVDMAHAIQQNGVGGPGTTPNGRVGTIDQNFSPAWRVGFVDALDSCSSIQGSYTNFRSHGGDTLGAQAGVGSTVSSQVLHPESLNAGSTSSLVRAVNDIDFQLAEIEYRRLLTGGMQHALNFTVGGRYGKLDQQFQQTGNFAPPIGSIQTTTNITFQGGGLRTGLDGQWNFGNTNLALYGKGFISLLFGRFNSSYTQLDTTSTIVQANSTWADNRVVPILEYEVGVSWTSSNNRWRITTGYYTAFWFNAVTTPQYVQAVQTANFVNLGQTIAFDGLVSRLEFRF
jgi:major outer membrane protein